MAALTSSLLSCKTAGHHIEYQQSLFSGGRKWQRHLVTKQLLARQNLLILFWVKLGPVKKAIKVQLARKPDPWWADRLTGINDGFWSASRARNPCASLSSVWSKVLAKHNAQYTTRWSLSSSYCRSGCVLLYSAAALSKWLWKTPLCCSGLWVRIGRFCLLVRMCALAYTPVMRVLAAYCGS